MRTVRIGPVIALIAALTLLLALDETVGLGRSGWIGGIAYGVIMNTVLARGLRDSAGLGPANRVTLFRATLVGGVTALAAASFARPGPATLLVIITSVALVLDAVDGMVARRTATVSALGARFDMEVDAFLILVLSLYVAHTTGAAWVLAIGAARYLFVAAGWFLPWLRKSLPPRYWRKVVAAIQGIVLAFAAANRWPGIWIDAALGMAMILLGESFGRDVWWLWRRRVPDQTPAQQPAHKSEQTLAHQPKQQPKQTRMPEPVTVFNRQLDRVGSGRSG